MPVNFTFLSHKRREIKAHEYDEFYSIGLGLCQVQQQFSLVYRLCRLIILLSVLIGTLKLTQPTYWCSRNSVPPCMTWCKA